MYLNIDLSSFSYLRLWLIRTWDVFKCEGFALGIEDEERLIRTWDVFKCDRTARKHMKEMINKNMRCI